MLIGIELDAARAIAVAVDADGAVKARAVVDAGTRLEEAARAALKRVQSGQNGSRVGFASSAPEAENVAAAIAALRAEQPATASGTAAALAESWVGAARGAAHVVFFGVGEHTSGGFVRGGSPDIGARGRAASVGWMSLNPVEREDYRKIGCLEAEVAAGGIVRRFVWRVKAGDQSDLQAAVHDDLSAITVAHILEAARAGDGVSVSVIRDTAKYLGMAAANLAALADPEVLVLGGLMASAADLLLEPVRAEISRRLPRPMLDGLKVVPAILGEDAAAIGAARIGSARP